MTRQGSLSAFRLQGPRIKTGGQEILSVLGDQFGARSPQQLRVSLSVAGAGGPGGSYSLEAMWTTRSTTLLP